MLSEGTCILASSQTDGTGRGERFWDSHPGGVYLSFLLKPAFLLNDLPWALLWAVLESVERLSALPFEIKAPNDLLYQQKKIAGMLIDSRIQGLTPLYYVCGLGFNLNQTDFSPELYDKAVSLRQLSSQQHDPDLFCRRFLACFAEKYAFLLSGHFEKQILNALGNRLIYFSYNSPDSVTLKEHWNARAR